MADVCARTPHPTPTSGLSRSPRVTRVLAGLCAAALGGSVLTLSVAAPSQAEPDIDTVRSEERL